MKRHGKRRIATVLAGLCAVLLAVQKDLMVQVMRPRRKRRPPVTAIRSH